MLSRSVEATPHAGISRVAALRGLVMITVRTAGLGRTFALVGLGAGPLLVAVLSGRSDVSAPLLVLALVSGASAGGVADDPAAEVLAPCPIPSSVRTGFRLSLTGGAVLLVGLPALTVGQLGPGLPVDWIDRFPELCAAAAVALAVGLVLHRRGEPFGAHAGISAGLLVPFTVAALGVRWPRTFPTFVASPIHDRWWLLSMAGLALALTAGRDPARRLVHVPRRSPRPSTSVQSSA